ncbi:MAG TPA: LytTR family DNA-binding domain-containing protein [Cytophagaceae bacterium]
MTLRCLIVDDEYLPLELLENYISKCQNLQLIGRCSNSDEARLFMEKTPIDILLIDIQMPGITGIEFVETLIDKPLVVFTTAYSHFAIEGFRLQAIDYLLKPFSFQRFKQALDKASEIFALKKLKEEKNHIIVKADYKSVKIDLDDILYIEGLGEYVRIFTTHEKVISLMALKNLETMLPATKFIRFHKSYIASINKIKSVTSNSLEIAARSFPIGRTYKRSVMNIKKNLLR